MIQLNHRTRFSSGGNRECYRHPDHSDRCLKILKECRTPEQRRNEKSFPANLRPLKSFDENLVELQVLNYLHANYPDAVRKHIPKCFGMVETDCGPALETSLILDSDGLISQTLEQYLWQSGLDTSLQKVIAEFKEDWATSPPNTRDLIPHNIVVQDHGTHRQIVLIDGFGRIPRMPSLDKLIRPKWQFKRRMENFDRRIQTILELIATNSTPPGRLTNLVR
ncbi:MAG: YrbL family protein [Coraliomargarita sp.]